MKFYTLVLIAIIYSFSQETIEMASSPEKENAASFTLINTLDGGEDGYYNKVTADVAPNGTIVVGDVGNKLILVYDKNYKLKHSFGKEGTGPGEINNIGSLKATNDRVYVNTYSRLLIFDYSGKYYTDLNLFEHGSAELLFANNEIRFVYKKGKFKEVAYDKNGKKIREQKNLDFKEEKSKSSSGFVFRFSTSGGEACTI